MSSSRSRAEKVAHNSQPMLKAKKKKRDVVEKPKCSKCKTEFIHVMNANKGKMERRCGCQ